MRCPSTESGSPQVYILLEYLISGIIEADFGLLDKSERFLHVKLVEPLELAKNIKDRFEVWNTPLHEYFFVL